ncbi:MAG TPA: PQQ-binding-like beta-propeller repeat protein [Rhizomicrobium sp.]|nr:PQQ-binding-like beta-propeller repeat protein [Rhizomicrobium sp.]
MNFCRFAAVKAVLAVALLLGGDVLAAPVPGKKAEAVAFQINPAHSGSTTLKKFNTPLKLKWNVALGGWVSYPLIADGKVFVTVSNHDTLKEWLFALDQKNGHILWRAQIFDPFCLWSNAAYDDGTVYVVNFEQQVTAFDAKTGAVNWNITLQGQSQVTSPPIASGGKVYLAAAGSGGTVYELDGKTGKTLWTQNVDGGDFSAPALGDNGLYVAYDCNAYGLNPTTGKLRWHYYAGCGGGAGETPAYSAQFVYARSAASSNMILRAKNGAVKGVFAATRIPAFYNDQNGNPMEAVVSGEVLYGIHADSGIVAWSFGGDGALDSAPIVVNGQVIEGSSQGNLYVLDGATGNVNWTTNTGFPIYQPNELSVNEPLTGLGAGAGLLVVPASYNLLAYQSQ